MSDRPLHMAALHKQSTVLSLEERAQLNAIIDLLIPADEEFPPPSSLHLIDLFLHHLKPSMANKTALVLNEKRLRILLRDINALAGGDFCRASAELQQSILRRLERCEPAVFQAIWTLANHSYYTSLATTGRPATCRRA